jgi:hypothetical protein
LIFKKKPNPDGSFAVQTAAREQPLPELSRIVPLCAGERRLYAALREAVPVIDAALDKIVRLTGGFTVACPGKDAEESLADFLETVPVGAAQTGAQSFLDGYLSQLLTYGSAVGEIVVRGGEFLALYNASLEDVELRADSPVSLTVCRREAGAGVPVPYPELVLCSALNPAPGSARGVSLLHGLPFVSGILTEIFRSVGSNWERLGNVRFAVTYKPTSDAVDQAFAKERAEQIAAEWGRAMRGGAVSDFISVGDVSIRAVGADCPIPDSEVPVRQILEQIVEIGRAHV